MLIAAGLSDHNEPATNTIGPTHSKEFSAIVGRFFPGGSIAVSFTPASRHRLRIVSVELSWTNSSWDAAFAKFRGRIARSVGVRTPNECAVACSSTYSVL